MSTIVQICNRALSKCGSRSQIASLDENSAEAAQCRLHYDCTRQSILRIHNWSFARRQISLALIAASAGTAENPTGSGRVPLSPWKYEYAYPSGILKVRSILQVISNGPAIPFILSSDDDTGGNPTRVVLTNQAQAELVYTRDIINPELWDSCFEDAVIAALAVEMVMPLTGDKEILQLRRQDLATALLQARTADSTETPDNQESIPDWVAVRGFTTSSSADAPFINAVLG